MRKPPSGSNRDDQAVAGLQIEAPPQLSRQHESATLSNGNGIALGTVHLAVVPRRNPTPSYHGSFKKSHIIRDDLVQSNQSVISAYSALSAVSHPAPARLGA
jgi:hypothetical protein